MEQFVEYLLSMKWIWVIIGFSISYLVRRISLYLTIQQKYKQDLIIRSIKFDNWGTERLDAIIDEVGEEYSISVLSVKEIYYMNTKAENDMLEYMKEEVPKRIPNILIQKLGCEYAEDYVGTLIGNHIYKYVLNFVLNYNIQSEKNNG